MLMMRSSFEEDFCRWFMSAQWVDDMQLYALRRCHEAAALRLPAQPSSGMAGYMGEGLHRSPATSWSMTRSSKVSATSNSSLRSSRRL